MKGTKKSAGAYAGLLVGLLAIVSLGLYMIYGTSADGLMVTAIPVMLGVIVLTEAVLFFLDNDWLPVLAAALSAACFGLFAYTPPETIGSIVDYYQNIVMFGNPEKFGLIVAVLAVMLLMMVVAIAACFMRRTKKVQE